MDVSEFSDFFHTMFPRLAGYAQRRVSPTEAEDLAAAALQTIWTKNPDSPRDDREHRQLQNLAYRVLDGLVQNAWRADFAYHRALDAVGRQASPQPPDIVEQIVSDEWPAWAGTLSLTDREVLELIVDGYKVGEIAIILDCTPAAVTMRLQRAKNHARRLWTEQEEVRRGPEL